MLPFVLGTWNGAIAAEQQRHVDGEAGAGSTLWPRQMFAKFLQFSPDH
jgi:hypothetical protein